MEENGDVFYHSQIIEILGLALMCVFILSSTEYMRYTKYNTNYSEMPTTLNYFN